MKIKIVLIFFLMATFSVYTMHRTACMFLKSWVMHNPHWILVNNHIANLQKQPCVYLKQRVDVFLDNRCQNMHDAIGKKQILEYGRDTVFAKKICRVLDEHNEYDFLKKRTYADVRIFKTNIYCPESSTYDLAQGLMCFILDGKTFCIILSHDFFDRPEYYQKAMLDHMACRYADQNLYRESLLYADTMMHAVFMRAEVYSALQSLQNAVCFRDNSCLTYFEKKEALALLYDKNKSLGGVFINEFNGEDSFDILQQQYALLLNVMKSQKKDTTEFVTAWNTIRKKSPLNSIIQDHLDHLKHRCLTKDSSV